MTIFAEITRAAQIIPKIQLKTAETLIKCKKTKVKYFCKYLMQLGVVKVVVFGFSVFLLRKTISEISEFVIFGFPKFVRILTFWISEFGQFQFP